MGFLVLGRRPTRYIICHLNPWQAVIGVAGTCLMSFVVQLEEVPLYSDFEKCQSHQNWEVPLAFEVGLVVEAIVAEFNVGC